MTARTALTSLAASAASAAPAIAVDAGARFLRVARTRADGTPELVELPGAVPGEGLPTPAAVRGDRGAALSVAYSAYREHCGTPGQVVLVVPPRERAVPSVDGTVPPPRLLDTPHAVLALLRHADTLTAPRWLVCDLGASAAEVTECAVVGGSVAVVRVARYTPADDGYGAAFDAAVLAAAGLPGDDPGTLRELGRARARNARRIEVALDRLAARPDRIADTVVYEVAGREITADLVHRALDRLRDGLDQALDGLPGARTTGPDPSRPPVIAVGGTARSGALLRHLTDRLGRPVPLPGGTDPALAAVFGAALVAGGHIDPADRYPHAVAVRVHRTTVGRPRDGELLISPPGTLEPGGPTVFAEADGERVRVRTGRTEPTGGRGDGGVRAGGPGGRTYGVAGRDGGMAGRAAGSGGRGDGGVCVEGSGGRAEGVAGRAEGTGGGAVRSGGRGDGGVCVEGLGGRAEGVAGRVEGTGGRTVRSGGRGGGGVCVEGSGGRVDGAAGRDGGTGGRAAGSGGRADGSGGGAERAGGPGEGAGGREVRILVRADGTGDVAPVGVVTIPPSGDGAARFHIGVRLAVDGTACLVLQPLGRNHPGEHPAEYGPLAQPQPEELPLGFLPTDLQSGSSSSDPPPNSPSNPPPNPQSASQSASPSSPPSPFLSDPPPDSEGART